MTQEFVPTPFDWRVGVLNREPIYVCRYHMARRHWQIVKKVEGGGNQYGRVDVVPTEEAPESVVRTAVKAAGLIGDGLYGVDLKEIGNRTLVIEINDNPSIDAGYEDALQKEQLYSRILAVFVSRLDRLRGVSS